MEDSVKPTGMQWIRTIVPAILSGLAAVDIGIQTGDLVDDDDPFKLNTLSTFALGAFLFPFTRTTVCFLTSLFGMSHYRKTLAFLSGGTVGAFLGSKGPDPQQKLGFILFGVVAFLLEMLHESACVNSFSLPIAKAFLS